MKRDHADINCRFETCLGMMSSQGNYKQSDVFAICCTKAAWGAVSIIVMPADLVDVIIGSTAAVVKR